MIRGGKRWLKPAAMFAAAAAIVRVERTLQRADRRRADRIETAQAIDELTERSAEEQLPQPTIWPIVLAVGIVFGLWGIILHTFFFGIGIVLAIMALAGWMNLLFHEEKDYLRITPHEDPRSK